MATARDLIKAAFSDLDTLEAEASVEDSDIQEGFDRLKRAMSSFQLKSEMGWTTPASLDATLSISDDDELFVQSLLALRLAGAYDIAVPNTVRESYRESRKDVFSRHVRLDALTYGALPLSRGRGAYGYDRDTNGLITDRTSKTVSSDYTLVLTDDLILVDASGGPVTITLMAASTADGYGFEVQKIDQSPNQVIITPNGSDTVFDDPDFRFNEYLHCVSLVSEGGANWL